MALLKLDHDGDYQWHTFFGSDAFDAGDTGIGTDYARAIKLDSAGNPCMIGRSKRSWNVRTASPLHAYTGDDDLVIVATDSDGEYKWHTFYGSSVEDRGQDIALDSNDRIYAIGYSRAAWNGDNDTAPLNTISGDGNRECFELALDIVNDETGIRPVAVGGEVRAIGGWGSLYYQLPLALAGLALIVCAGCWTARHWFGR